MLERHLSRVSVDGQIEPWTLKGVFATAALALIRIAVALERIAVALEAPAPVHREEGKRNA